MKEPKTGCVRVCRSLLNGQFLVELQQLEIGARDIAYERGRDSATRFVGGEILGASGFAETTDATPKVNFPDGVQIRCRVTLGRPVQTSGRVEECCK